MTRPQRVARMLDDGEEQAHHAIDEAGRLIWNSIRKFDGEPSDTMGHALDCGCIYCN